VILIIDFILSFETVFPNKLVSDILHFAVSLEEMKKALIQLHIAIFLAGFTGVLGRLITLNEGLLVWYRLLITAVTMWIVFSVTKKLQKISFKDILKISGVGIIAAMHWVTFYGAIKYANISVALVCFSSVGFFTALLEPLFYRKRIIPFEVFLGLMVIAGIYIIFHFDPEYKTGIVLGIISALLIAVVMILVRQFLQRINSETFLTWQLTGAFLGLSLLMPFYLYLFPASHIFPSVKEWIWLLVLAWFCSVLAFQFSTKALKRLSAFTVNISYNFEPLYGILMAFALFGENKELDWSFYVGLTMIILAVALQMWRVWMQSKVMSAKKIL
jgi:drug/metabolite transporter (DMT)-like permease